MDFFWTLVKTRIIYQIPPAAMRSGRGKLAHAILILLMLVRSKMGFLVNRKDATPIRTKVLVEERIPLRSSGFPRTKAQKLEGPKL